MTSNKPASSKPVHTMNPHAATHIVRKKINWRQDQPAPAEAYLLIHLCFPQTHNGGIYVPKLTGGRPSGHAYGKAVDVMLSVNKPVEKMIGDGLFNAMIACADDAGIAHVIWNRQIWSTQNRTPHPFVGNYKNGQPKDPHTNHIHIEWTWRGSQLHRADFVAGKLHAVEPPRAIETELGTLKSNLEDLGIYGDSESQL